MCTIKNWLPPRAPSANLKRQGLAESHTRASWGFCVFCFFLTYSLSGAAWSRACWTRGLPDTHSFLNGLFCSQDLNRVFFPLPSFCEPKREKGEAPSLPECLCGRGVRPLANGVLPPGQLAAPLPGSEPGRGRTGQAPSAHVSIQQSKTRASLPQTRASRLDGVWPAWILKGSKSFSLCAQDKVTRFQHW